MKFAFAIIVYLLIGFGVLCARVQVGQPIEDATAAWTIVLVWPIRLGYIIGAIGLPR